MNTDPSEDSFDRWPMPPQALPGGSQPPPADSGEERSAAEAPPGTNEAPPAPAPRPASSREQISDESTISVPPPQSPRPSDRLSQRLARAPAAEKGSRDPLVGTILDGRFKILSPLGSGGMATVYRAWHLLLEKVVALKVIRPDAEENPRFQQRFFLEARAASAFVHPNAVPMREFGETPTGLFYLVMDFCPGRSLQELLVQEGRLPPERAVRIVLQILAALGEAHRQGIVHRDIKPANVVVDEADHVRVLDFGLAKILHGDDSGSHHAVETSPQPPAAPYDPEDAPTLGVVPGATDHGLTRPGAVMGTPRYMAPEQARGEPCTARSDLYSVGVVLYELLCGKPPFVSRDVHVLLACHVLHDPPPMRDTAPDLQLPGTLEEVTMRALLKDPADRYATAEEFADALRASLAADPGGSTPSAPPASSRRGLLLAAGTIALFTLLVTATALRSFPRNGASKETLAPVPSAVGTRTTPGEEEAAPFRTRLRRLRAQLEAPLPVDLRAARRFLPDVLERYSQALAQGEALSLSPHRDSAQQAIAQWSLALQLRKQIERSVALELRNEVDRARRAAARLEAQLDRSLCRELAPREFAALPAAPPPSDTSLDALQRLEARVVHLRRLQELVAARAALRSLVERRSVAERRALELYRERRPHAAVDPAAWERAAALLAEARATTAPLVSALPLERIRAATAAVHSAVQAYESAALILSSLRTPPPEQHTKAPSWKQRRTELRRRLVWANAEVRKWQAELDRAPVAGPLRAELRSAILRLHRELTQLRSSLDEDSCDLDAAERSLAALEARSKATSRRVEEAIAAAKRLADALSQARANALELKKRVSAGARRHPDAELSAFTARGESLLRRAQALEPSSEALQTYEAARRVFRTALEVLSDHETVHGLLSKLARAIERRKLSDIAACYGGRISAEDLTRYKSLFRRAKRVRLQIVDPRVHGDVGTARVTHLEYVDRLRDVRVPLGAYTVHLQRVGKEWRVRSLAPD
ncbi:MAG: serine/threonine protein kinase [Planctomycetota bacterium]|nr:MAG: serine/threonine protein kinase [Planctomycetota bacterium]